MSQKYTSMADRKSIVLNDVLIIFPKYLFKYPIVFLSKGEVSLIAAKQESMNKARAREDRNPLLTPE